MTVVDDRFVDVELEGEVHRIEVDVDTVNRVVYPCMRADGLDLAVDINELTKAWYGHWSENANL